MTVEDVGVDHGALEGPKESKECVLLLGAGASREFGLPIMKDFMDVARNKYFEYKTNRAPEFELTSAYRALLEFHNECRASTWAFRRNWENMEELYTQADLVRLSAVTEEEEKRANHRCQEIAWTIWDVYRKFSVEIELPLANICRSILKANLFPVVITTNYDLVWEHRLISDPKPMSYLYPGFDAMPGDTRDTWCFETNEDVYERRGKGESLEVPIIKLHGSVNWFSVANSDWFAAAKLAMIRKCDSEMLKNDLRKTLIEMKFPGAASEIMPGIVPPMLGKSPLATAITHQWKAAIKAISSARQIWVLGYSFPITDAFMPRLLTEGLRQNHHFERLVIVDKQSKEEWKERIEAMFGYMLREQKLSFFSLNAQKALSIMASNRLGNWLGLLRDHSAR